MRLGGPVFTSPADPDQWAMSFREAGYRATYPPPNDWPARDVMAAAQRHELVIAEIGAWSNPITRDDAQRQKAIDLCTSMLARADELGARCCVNIAGSRGQTWDGPDADNYTEESFELIVRTVRQILDAVKPTRTFYTLETMPWICPDSPDEYLRVLRAVDRARFAVHLDPVNLINSPRLAFGSGALLRDCFSKLGPYIKSCHAKDIRIANELTVHLSECRPGSGLLDYRTFLVELSKLDPDTPLLLEHLNSAEEYAAAAAHVRRIAGESGVEL